MKCIKKVVMAILNNHINMTPKMKKKKEEAVMLRLRWRLITLVGIKAGFISG